MTCRYQRSHDEKTALCLSPIVTAPGQLVPLAVCAKCRVRDRGGEPRDPATIKSIEPPTPPAAAADEFVEAGPCVHRSKQPARVAECKVCGMREELAEVFACSLHGECTLRGRGIRGAMNCLGCPDADDGE